MANQMIKHGSETGYRTELARGEVCPRCRNGHRQFDKQYTKGYKSRGVRYGSSEVLDHLYVPGRRSAASGSVPGTAGRTAPAPSPVLPEIPDGTPASPGQSGDSAGKTPLRERMNALIGGIKLPGEEDAHTVTYVSDDEPGYVHDSGDYDPDPAGEEWTPAPDEFLVNAAGLKQIEDNLGTYLSVIGMTAEMIDPYCGAMLAQNFENMVSKWSKLIAHYPKAAALFMDAKGGVIFTWIGAIQATWPVLYAFYEHHLAKTVRVQDGVIQRRTGNGNGGMPDSTTPPFADDFNYSAN